jgi:hypothetical protein
MTSILVIISAIVLVALLRVGYVGLGGRALLGTHEGRDIVNSCDEHPQRIIGRRVQLTEMESGPLGLDANQPRLPPANVESFGPDGQYSLRFQLPVIWLGKRETHATLFSRHVGYPVSSAADFDRRCLAVAGYFGSGEAFIGLLRVLRESEG